MGERAIGDTQVYRLDINTLQIEKVETKGDKPGWISRHKAYLRNGNCIYVAGGKLDDGKDYVDNKKIHFLNLDTLVWEEVDKLP
jgi:hypothetical protein